MFYIFFTLNNMLYFNKHLHSIIIRYNLIWLNLIVNLKEHKGNNFLYVKWAYARWHLNVRASAAPPTSDNAMCSLSPFQNVPRMHIYITTENKSRLHYAHASRRSENGDRCSNRAYLQLYGGPGRARK